MRPLIPCPAAWSWREAVILASLLSLALSPAGCVSNRVQLQTDLSGPGWVLRQGQAVWRPQTGKADLAGELLVATHPDGRSLVHFSKPPFPLVLAQRSVDGWQIQFGPQGRVFSGGGTPPLRFLWLHLPEWLSNPPAAPDIWIVNTPPGDPWRFQNRSSGELLEGYLNP